MINELELFQPYSYDPYQDDRAADMKPFVDVPMDFNVLSEQEWSRAHSEDITVRKMFDLKEFGISFELGTFWYNNPGLQKYCTDNLNETWFYDSDQVSERQSRHGGDALLVHPLYYGENNDFGVYGVVVVMLCLVLVAGCCSNAVCGEKGQWLDDGQYGDEYGSLERLWTS